ncbi:MAG: BLUF domain-containing protein [Pseudomonadota bacterium]
MSLHQIIYMSQPFGYDAAILSGVLLDARRCNERDGITGALICRRDIYLQLLEGPEAAVHSAFERISRDDRHIDVALLVSEAVTDRMFGEWAMLHDPSKSWLWTEQDVAYGAVEYASADDIKDVFAVLKANMQSS